MVLFRITALEILFLGLVCLNDLVEDDASSSVAAPRIVLPSPSSN